MRARLCAQQGTAPRERRSEFLLARSIKPAEMVCRDALPRITTDASAGVKSGGGDGISTESSSVKAGSRPCRSQANSGKTASPTSKVRPIERTQMSITVNVAFPAP